MPFATLRHRDSQRSARLLPILQPVRQRSAVLAWNISTTRVATQPAAAGIDPSSGACARRSNANVREQGHAKRLLPLAIATVVACVAAATGLAADQRWSRISRSRRPRTPSASSERLLFTVRRSSATRTRHVLHERHLVRRTREPRVESATLSFAGPVRQRRRPRRRGGGRSRSRVPPPGPSRSCSITHGPPLTRDAAVALVDVYEYTGGIRSVTRFPEWPVRLHGPHPDRTRSPLATCSCVLKTRKASVDPLNSLDAAGLLPATAQDCRWWSVSLHAGRRSQCSQRRAELCADDARRARLGSSCVAAARALTRQRQRTNEAQAAGRTEKDHPPDFKDRPPSDWSVFSEGSRRQMEGSRRAQKEHRRAGLGTIPFSGYKVVYKVVETG